MAPVTRRRTKALETSQPDSSIISDPEVDSVANTPSQSHKSQDSTPRTKSGARSKRKSTDAAPAATGGEDEPSQRSRAESTPNKRKRLAVRTRVEESPSGDHRKVHIEATVLNPADGPVAASRRRETVADSEVEEDSDGGAPEPESATKQLQEEAVQKLASQSAEPEPAAAAPKGKHVVFGDDDDVDNFVAEAAAKDGARRVAEKESASESDDDNDEGPEAVTTAAAAKQSKKVEQAAVDAAEQLAATQKRKRQDRDARFREQAEERKRAEAEAKTARQHQRISKRDLPDVLPAEFLEDSDSDSDGSSGGVRGGDSHMRKLRKKRKLAEAQAEAALAESQARKIRFDEVAEGAERAEAERLGQAQRPRDVVLGSTVYRVLAAPGDQRLAPKVRKNARSVKEDLLKRKRGAFATNKKKGFFVNK